MPRDGARLEQTRLADNLFWLGYAGRSFLMQAYPVRILEVDRPVAQEDLSDELVSVVRGKGESCSPPFRGFGAVELVATTRCNLRCTHCTARSFDEDHSGFYGLTASDMSPDVMQAAVDAGILQLEERLLRHPIARPTFEMFITGGEPLLVWADLRAALAHAREKLAAIPGTEGFTFTPHIVSNGQLIDERMAEELTAAGTVITVALDSPFNQVRVDAEGRAATPKAIQAVKNLVKAGHTAVSVNVVVDGTEFDKIDRVMDYLHGEGAFEGITTIQLSPLAPPIQHAEHAGLGLSTRRSGYEDPRTCAGFSAKLIEYSDRFGVDMKQYGQKLGALLVQGGSLYRCPVAEWKWCVVPGGDVYACHQLVSIGEFRMGNVLEPDWYAEFPARSVRNRFLERTVFTADLCASCALVSSCMVFVDCPARSYLERGDISEVVPHYCHCGKPYLERLLGEHAVRLVDCGLPAEWPMGDR